MAEISVLHNPRCSTSRAALEAAQDAGVEVDVVEYLKKPLTSVELRALVEKLEDEPSDLVRRDATFKELELTDEDVATGDQVIALLTEHPKLMQRPVLVKGDRAIIGRPKERVPEFLNQE